MGTQGSFPIFALTHGLLVSFLANKLGIRGEPFDILGDDIIIRDDKLADLYLSTLDTLGIPISRQKTMRCKHLVEFAKRWFYHGIEVTPFPVSTFLEYFTPFQVEDTLRMAEDRAWRNIPLRKGPGNLTDYLLAIGYHPMRAKVFISSIEDLHYFPISGDSYNDAM